MKLYYNTLQYITKQFQKMIDFNTVRERKLFKKMSIFQQDKNGRAREAAIARARGRGPRRRRGCGLAHGGGRSVPVPDDRVRSRRRRARGIRLTPLLNNSSRRALVLHRPQVDPPWRVGSRWC